MTQLTSMTELTAMIDTSSCDREPIHILGLTQEFGAVIATSLDWNITHYSENIFELLGLANASVLGEPLGKLLPKAAQQQIQQAASRLGAEQEVEQLFGITLSTYKDNRFVVRLHRNGDHLIIDIEPDLEGLPDAGSSLIKLQSNINRLRLEESITDRAQSTAELVKALTGFDRVMIYKFIENDDGQVIAEALEPDMEPYLGLRYPASDIPKQARELYKRSPIRVIADVSDKGCAILPAKGPDGKPLDLSLSMIRSVSPVHLVYLRNMGVAASMSVSLLVQDRLWGLIACHHNTPFLPDPRLRAAAEVVGHFFALSLDELETKEDQEARDKAQTVHDKVVVHFSHDANIIDGFNTLVSATRQALDFDGAMVWINDRFDATGTALTEEEFKALLPVLNRTANGRQFITDHLVSIHPEATSYADRVSGIIVIPISRQPRDYLVFCRKEQVIDLLWAGDPTKQVVQDPKHAKLMPRNSFAAWQETRRMHSTPWSKGDERLATGLRITLLEIALRMSDATLVERQQAQAQQEILIAELNHRVRNILNLIRNLITQSQVGAETVHDFTQIVGGRIHALAHAHDLITKRNWNAASLNDLIQIETRAYLGSKADRVHAHGVDAMIEPHAFTTIALVLHELITNSSKHGALCDSLGQVSIQSWAEPDGTLNLEWREKGGPKVKPPLLMSFGTTIIERSIPFELNGTADLQFLPEGVYARFSIPSSYLDIQHATPLGPARPETGSLTTRLDQGDQAARQRLLKRVLLVEDSMLIAMGTEQHLDKLGAERVFLTANNSDGIRYVEREHPTLCILDINLDGDVSTPVAEALVAANIPFVLATGYGSADGFLSKFPKVPLITKPYGMEELTEAIDQLITSIGQASNRHLPNDDVADHSGFIH